MGIDWGKIGKILGSPAVQNVAGIAGAGISAYADNKQNTTNSKQQAAQFAAQMALQQQSQQANQGIARAGAAADASPLGANENFAAKQALRHMVLSGMRNPTVTASDPGVAAAMPKITSPFQLPPGGVPQSVLAHLAPGATAGAIGQRQQHISNIDPNAPGVNFQRMGFGAADAMGPQAETDAYRGQALGRQQDEQSRTAEQLKLALAQSSAAAQDPEKKKSGGILSKIGSVLKVAAPIAGTFIGGPALGAAIGGIGSAVGSKLQGNSLGGALKAGLGGAAAAGIGNAAIPGGAGAGSRALSGVNAASQWTPSAPPQAPPPGIDPRLLQQALRRQYAGG